MFSFHPPHSRLSYHCLKRVLPQTCPFSILLPILVEIGQNQVLYCRMRILRGILAICLLVSDEIAQKRKLKCMLMHINKVGFERFKLPRMA